MMGAPGGMATEKKQEAPAIKRPAAGIYLDPNKI